MNHGACAVLNEQLWAKAHSGVLLPPQRTEKTRVMQCILQNDTQICYQAQPWLAHCEQALDGPRQPLHLFAIY